MECSVRFSFGCKVIYSLCPLSAFLPSREGPEGGSSLVSMLKVLLCGPKIMKFDGRFPVARSCFFLWFGEFAESWHQYDLKALVFLIGKNIIPLPAFRKFHPVRKDGSNVVLLLLYHWN